jgi:hypothetical protein
MEIFEDFIRDFHSRTGGRVLNDEHLLFIIITHHNDIMALP